MSDNPTTKLLTTRELASMLGLKPRTVDTWRVTGEGPPFVRIGRVVRYRQSDIETFLAGQLRRSTSDPGDG
ncbi:MAG TPA: helix-turn-helix domain-containing protein [Gemmatimonadaceae bacterium]|nr:helix-turn-helix domain-containing protein [Gemmatimonadaceae bacterium]